MVARMMSSHKRGSMPEADQSRHPDHITTAPSKMYQPLIDGSTRPLHSRLHIIALYSFPAPRRLTSSSPGRQLEGEQDAGVLQRGQELRVARADIDPAAGNRGARPHRPEADLFEHLARGGRPSFGS